ncbi:nucleotidyltransferase-like protein [Paenibacillus maysiensis]|uniref:nucleotidyltransferase-like protein n=1 Tax=Paenibacillus maysiensis TaxID=1155954 RepID=UPI0004718C7E|nr:nucleotidyltransferase-like protein [Paenibacillus maysiensis]
MQLTKLSLMYDELLQGDSIGIISYRKPGEYFHGAMLYDFDELILIIGESRKPARSIQHLLINGLRCQVLYATLSCLKGWIIAGEHANIIDYLLEGHILWERDERVSLLRREIIEFNDPLREQKQFHEFARFLVNYVHGKRAMREGRIIDAHQSILKALDHWASIELIKRGIYPTVHLWVQIQPLDRTIYKLYNELTLSTETLEQRVELVLLACEFSVMSKMEGCSAPLFRILGSRREPWSINELINHPELKNLQLDLTVVLRKLVYRSLIRESVGGNLRDHGHHSEIRYSLI